MADEMTGLFTVALGLLVPRRIASERFKPKASELQVAVERTATQLPCTRRGTRD